MQPIRRTPTQKQDCWKQKCCRNQGTLQLSESTIHLVFQLSMTPSMALGDGAVPNELMAILK
jgi:hypothetical protein